MKRNRSDTRIYRNVFEIKMKKKVNRKVLIGLIYSL